jgi:hypothetical protein
MLLTAVMASCAYAYLTLYMIHADVLVKMLMPNAVWRAGAVAATIRKVLLCIYMYMCMYCMHIYILQCLHTSCAQWAILLIHLSFSHRTAKSCTTASYTLAHRSVASTACNCEHSCTVCSTTPVRAVIILCSTDACVLTLLVLPHHYCCF